MAYRARKIGTQDDVRTLGLTGWRGCPTSMEHTHRHQEVELNYVEMGAITYLFGGVPVIVEAGRLTLFWAAIPHRIARFAPETTLCWVTVPLSWFLQWDLPRALTDEVLYGRPVVDLGHGHARSDQDLFRQWVWDMDADTGAIERRRIVLLEIEARLRRLALAAPIGGEAAGAPGSGRVIARAERGGKAEGMARFIADHYAEPVRLADIAAAVGLHPNYAMGLFRATFGMSVVTYLTQYRVAVAQRLLATTDAAVLDIALDVGFGSASRFYAVFKEACARSPRDYRAALRAPL